VLLIAPTGGGKSICYQLPALVLPGTTLVISPLVALMEDQVRGLTARSIPATYFASTLTAEENARRLRALRAGAYKLVYVAPERLGHEGLIAALVMIGTPLVAIDEAHCIVQWGHDFRPDYLRIGEALKRLGAPRILACTATATRAARLEIMHCLGWNARDTKTIVRELVRPNLSLNAKRVKGKKEMMENIAHALKAALRGPGAGIVYAATRKMAEFIGKELEGDGFDAPVYHAGTNPEERARISAEFAAQKTRVLVATNAFGMGIDRPDVRIVIHGQAPASLDAYYQEVGRAGRDGQPARGLLLLTRSDIALRRRFSERGAGGAPQSREDQARANARLSALIRFVDAKVCRQASLRRYFGEEGSDPNASCGICDVCLEALLGPSKSGENQAPQDEENAPDTVRDPPCFEAQQLEAQQEEKPEDKPQAGKSRPPLIPGVPREIYEALCRYRAARARSLGVPCYVVAPNRSLVEMAMLRPETTEELGRVHGMGKTRLSSHGEGFLRALRETHPTPPAWPATG
jgi:ATP-dependent DNA helicase RecQ